MTIVLVALGAAVGAPVRYGIARLLRRGRHHPQWGTFAANVLGSLAFGIIAGGTAVGALSPAVFALAGVGFCGALTTFSTFGYETLELLHRGSGRAAAQHVLLSLVVGLGAAWVGLRIAAAAWA